LYYLQIINFFSFNIRAILSAHVRNFAGRWQRSVNSSYVLSAIMPLTHWNWKSSKNMRAFAMWVVECWAIKSVFCVVYNFNGHQISVLPHVLIKIRSCNIDHNGTTRRWKHLVSWTRSSWSFFVMSKHVLFFWEKCKLRICWH